MDFKWITLLSLCLFLYLTIFTLRYTPRHNLWTRGNFCGMNKGILEHVAQYMEICLRRKTRCIRSRSLYKNTQNLVLFFLIPSNTGYLHAIHNLCWTVLKIFPKGKESTFTYVCIFEYVCVFCPNLNESINVIFS